MQFKHLNIAIFLIGMLALAGGITLFALSHTPSANTSLTTSQTPTSPKPTTNATNSASTKPTPTSAHADAPLYFTTMTHMEGNFKDDVDQNLFNKHVSDIRASMDLFDTVGAKLTIESEQSFAKANTKWGVNFLKEVVDTGHGVGTHADFGAGKNEDYTAEEYAAKFAENKALVDNLVGAENNQGVSGGFGPGDWVTAAVAGGFKYLDGLTAFGYLSMPLKNRPEEFTNDYILHTAYHDSIPPAFEDRLYLYNLKDANDLVADANGDLTIMGGEIGELASIAEGRSNCSPNCTFDQDDIDAVIDYIKQADEIRDHSRVARINLHIPTSLLTEAEQPMLQRFLEAIKPYADDGTIIFATQLEAYQGYTAFNNTK